MPRLRFGRMEEFVEDGQSTNGSSQQLMLDTNQEENRMKAHLCSHGEHATPRQPHDFSHVFAILLTWIFAFEKWWSNPVCISCIRVCVTFSSSLTTISPVVSHPSEFHLVAQCIFDAFDDAQILADLRSDVEVHELSCWLEVRVFRMAVAHPYAIDAQWENRNSYVRQLVSVDCTWRHKEQAALEPLD